MDNNKGFLGMIKNIPSLKKKDKEETRNNENHPTDNSTLRNMGVAGGASVIARKHADKAAETFKKPSSYNQQVRKQYLDDPSAHKAAIDNAFSSGKTVRDPYSGAELVKSQKEAKLLYGEEWQKHAAEADHIDPLNQIYKRNKNNPFATTENLKEVANSPDNVQVLSRELNQPSAVGKGGSTQQQWADDAKRMSNLEGVIETKENVETVQKRIRNNGEIAQKRNDAKIRSKSIKNATETAHKSGVDAAKSGALIGGGISAIQNVVAVVKGEKDAGEAVIDTAKDTAGAAVLSYSTGALGSNISYTLSYSSNTMLQSLSKTNLPSQIAVAALETGKTMKKFICGEIDGTECMIELGEKGTGMIASSFGATIGIAQATTIQAAIGQTLIPIPIIGGMIGSMVGYAFASSYYNGLVSLMQDRKLAYEERIRIEAECAETLEAIRAYRSEVEKIAEAYFADHKRVFDTAFGTISQALQTGDADGVISGANMITEKLGGEVQYRNMKEFDEFMNDEDVDFVL